MATLFTGGAYRHRCTPADSTGIWRSGRITYGFEEYVLIKVRPRGNESIPQMLKRFKRLCQREGLTRDMKRHSYYEKPSERKRRQSRKAIRRIEKDANS